MRSVNAYEFRKIVPVLFLFLLKQIGSKKGSNDCSKEYVCKKRGRGKRFIKVTTGKKCHRNALCTYDTDGVRSCQCKKGFIGDGYKKCEGTCQTLCYC